MHKFNLDFWAGKSRVWVSRRGLEGLDRKSKSEFRKQSLWRAWLHLFLHPQMSPSSFTAAFILTFMLSSTSSFLLFSTPLNTSAIPPFSNTNACTVTVQSCNSKSACSLPGPLAVILCVNMIESCSSDVPIMFSGPTSHSADFQ